MAARIETFGEFRGQPVERVWLDNGRGLGAAVLNWGGVLQDLTLEVDGSRRSLVLNFPEFADYPAKSPYFGATVGRFGNRIGGAAFELDGQRFELDPNERGRNHLHGGLTGWGKRLWDIEDADATHVTLALTSPDGEMGYPGTVEARCTYRLTDDALVIEMTATTTRATPLNMVHHSYWNLDGEGSIEAHQLSSTPIATCRPTRSRSRRARSCRWTARSSISASVAGSTPWARPTTTTAWC
jgi:aldose 1-epimerase